MNHNLTQLMKIKIKGNPLYSKIYNRTYKKRQNTLILIQGEPGTGKSICGAKVGYDNDPKFNSITEEEIDNFLRERVLRTPKQFIDLINSDKLKKGSWIMFDEAGAGISNRDWWSFQNKAVSRILQTFRNRRLIAVFTTPKASLLDKAARELFNFEIRTESIDFSRKLTKTKILELTFHYHYQVMSRKFISYRNKKDNKIYEYPSYSFPIPPKFIVKGYEKYAEEFKKDIVAELAREADLINRKEISSSPNIEENIMKDIEENLDDYISTYHSTPSIQVAVLMAKHDISDSLARKLRVKAQAKFKDRLEKFANPPIET